QWRLLLRGQAGHRYKQHAGARRRSRRQFVGQVHRLTNRGGGESPTLQTSMWSQADMTTRLLLVDDHPLVRHGLRLRLESVPGLQVVCEASRAEEALQLAQEYEPDIAVVDLGLPDTSGLELTTLLLRRAPNL